MTSETVRLDRLVDDFVALVSISSPSRREADVARWLTATLTGMGVRVSEAEAAMVGA